MGCCCAWSVSCNTTVSAKWPAVTFLRNTAKAGRTRGPSVELHTVAHIPLSAVVRLSLEDADLRVLRGTAVHLSKGVLVDSSHPDIS